MKKCNRLLGLLGFLAIASLPTSSAHAQNIRSWVSSTGSDLNSCERSAPCGSFFGAVSKTNAGGEVNCVDASSYGLITISKSITIDCSGILGIAYPGVRINAGPTDKVIIRGLSIIGSALVPGSGIWFQSGGELNVENVSFENFSNAGILVDKSAFGILTVRNSSFTEMPIGIKLQTSAGNIVASISETKFNGMTSHGVEANARSYAAVTYSVFSTNNGSAMIAATPTSTVYAKNNTITNCATGVNAAVAGAKITASGNGIYGNSKAFNAVAGATFLSANNNEIDINPGNPPTGTLTTR